jgi:hypothetical protein
MAMAELEYGKLIRDNPENLEYIAGLQKARGLDKGRNVLYGIAKHWILTQV